jgi:mono/diheme cytochrome c family protein
MRIEIKGLLLALAAALVVLGATFGLSALVRGSGSGQPPPRAAGASAGSGLAAPAVSAAQAAQGRLFYTQSCASCHGADAEGGFGPGLHNEDMSDARITHVIIKGKGRMPAFGTKYGDTQTRALIAYIRTLK